VSQAEIAKKSLKNPYYRGSRSFKVIDVDTNEKLKSLLLVMISSMYVPICNSFHATRDNCGKISTSKGEGVAVFDARMHWLP